MASEMNRLLEDDLVTLNGVVCHYGRDGQRKGVHKFGKWQSHAKYAMGKPNPSGGAKKTLKKVTKVHAEVEKLENQLADLQKKLKEHKDDEKAYRDQYEREKSDDRSVRRKQADFRREQKARYKERKKKEAAERYRTISHVLKETHEERRRDAKSKVPMEIKYFTDRIKSLAKTVSRKKTSIELGVSRAITFRSALAIDKAFSKQLFKTTLSPTEYKDAYNITRELYQRMYGDDIAEIMRPRL